MQEQLEEKDRQIEKLKKEFGEYKAVSLELEEFLGEDVKRLQRQLGVAEQRQEQGESQLRRLKNEVLTLERENDQWEAQLNKARVEAEAQRRRIIELEQDQDHLHSKIRIREHETSELVQLNES